MRSGVDEDKISSNNRFSVIALLAIRNWRVSRRRPDAPDWAGLAGWAQKGPPC